MKLSKKVDAISGPIIPKIINYTIPVILSTLLQSMFQAVDMVVLGNMADSTAVASVGATSTIIALLLNSFVGFSSGIKVLVARFIGSKEKDKLKRTVDTTMLLALILGAFVMLLSWVAAPLFLTLTDCPEECYKGALVYMRIYLMFAPTVLIYNFGSAIIKANGDTKRPLYYMVLGGMLNAILNVILCLVLEEKVAAVAISTAASNLVGAVCVLVHLAKMKEIFSFSFKKIKWNNKAFGQLFSLGGPIALYNMLFPLANLQITAAVNSYGVSAVAGNGASNTMQSLSGAVHSSFAASTGVFIGQNLGAEKTDRVKKSFFHCLWISFVFAFIFGIFFYRTGRFWLGFIVPDDPVAVEYAMISMEHIIQFYFIAAVNGVLGQFIQSFGYSFLSSLNSVVFVLGFRVFWMNLVYPHIESFRGLMFCYTVSWTLLMITNIIMVSVVYRRYTKGKYKRF